MKKTPLIFSAENVCKIRDGIKSETRRLVREQPPFGCAYIINGARSHALCYKEATLRKGAWDAKTIWVHPTATATDHRLICPYGEPGDILWVKEAIHWNHNPANPQSVEPVYAADGARVKMEAGFYRTPKTGSAMFMPHWACRLHLRIVTVSVERLQDITDEGARREGVKNVAAYRKLWEKIHGEKSWARDRRKFVWVIFFHRELDLSGIAP